MACDHEWCKLCNCAFDTEEYENSDGCEAFTERPYLCDYHIDAARKKELELLGQAYDLKQKQKKTIFIAYSGACGKFAVTP